MAASVPEGAPSIRTAVPVLSADTVPRTQLLRRLRELAATPVVAVCAPAGYGKTTLLAQHAVEDDRPCAWLSLTPADDDPVALLTDIAEALARVEDVGSDVWGALRAGPAAVVPLALPRLGHALAARSAPFVLVLDDAQHIASPRAVDALRLLIDHLPPGSQLLLGTRSEPGFPVARMRVERRFAELGVDDLAMSPAEGADLLRAAGVSLDRTEAELVVDQTEGWAAALYLASLALREQQDGVPDRPAFSGRERSLGDYFREEVLAQADAEQIAFLTRTSMLARLTAPLCDAVLERTDSGEMLRALADANLFVSALDRHGEWYRVHALFAESLAEELRRADPGAEAELHGRASAWYAEQGALEQAVWHALQAGQVDRATDIMWLSAPLVISHGKAATYMRWMEWLDREQAAAHPTAALGAGWCELECGNGDGARDWLALAAAAPAGTIVSDGAPLEAHVALLRAGLEVDGIRPIWRHGDRARRIAPDDNVWQCMAFYFTGLANHLLGNLDLARPELEEAAVRSASVAATIHVLALSQLALLAGGDGDWTAATSYAHRAREHQRASGILDYASGAHVAATIALVAAESGDHSVARASARRAATTLATHERFTPWADALARLLLARTHLLLGDTVAARTMLGESAPFVARMPDAVVLLEMRDEVEALVERASVAIPGGPSSLTTAEVRVLHYLPTHMTFREIGAQLFISRNTVKTHALSVYRKLDVGSRSEAIERARELGVLENAGDRIIRTG